MLLQYQSDRAPKARMRDRIRRNDTRPGMSKAAALYSAVDDGPDSAPQPRYFAHQYDGVGGKPGYQHRRARAQIMRHQVNRFVCPRIALLRQAQDVVKRWH